MRLDPLKQLSVDLDFGQGRPLPLGRLALREGILYFEYDAEFLRKGLDVSPFRLPLKLGVQTFESAPFSGLPGLFNDSLPDGWGRLLFDRALRAEGGLAEEASPLDRLAHVGNSGMGALTYRPDQSTEGSWQNIDLDRLALQTAAILEGEAEEVLNELLFLNGSSAGARPKALLRFDPRSGRVQHGGESADVGEAWMVKFPNSHDGKDAGAIEFAYAKMAQNAGVVMSETHLFKAKKSPGFFGTKRFDREGGRRFHMHSACGLLHSDFRTPALDYRDLIELTTLLTRDVRETDKMFRLAVFNVLAHNRDDHSKNFSFLMDEFGQWVLSPAYDLTFSSGPRGEQSTMVMGEGRAPGLQHLYGLGDAVGLDQKRVAEVIEQTIAALMEWPTIAKACGVSSRNIKFIQKRLNNIR